VASQGRGGSAHQAAGTGPDYGNFLFALAAMVFQFSFIAGSRVDHAGAAHQGKDTVQTALVAGDAGIDFIGPVFGSLFYKIRIGQKWPGHGDHISPAIGNDLVCQFRGVDAVGCHQRYGEVFFEPLGNPGKGPPRHDSGGCGYAGLVPPHAGIYNGSAGRLDFTGQAQYLVKGAAARHQINHGKPVDNDKIRTDFVTHATDNRHRKPGPIFERPAPFVPALIDPRGQELV